MRVLVTGSSSGIGAAICRRIAAPGVALIVHARRNRAGAEAVAAEATAKGAKAFVVMGDLADPAAAARLVDAMVGEFGGVDAVVSNAGFADKTCITDLEPAAFDASMAAIATAFLRLARAAAPHLLASKGRVVAVSSFVAHLYRTDVTRFAASAAAKAALEALVKVLALELAPAVAVNAIAPGFIRKEAAGHSAMDPEQWRKVIATIPLARLGEPADIAAAVAFLLSPEAGYITGQVIHVNGGLIV